MQSDTTLASLSYLSTDVARSRLQVKPWSSSKCLHSLILIPGLGLSPWTTQRLWEQFQMTAVTDSGSLLVLVFQHACVPFCSSRSFSPVSAAPLFMSYLRAGTGHVVGTWQMRAVLMLSPGQVLFRFCWPTKWRSVSQALGMSFKKECAECLRMDVVATFQCQTLSTGPGIA